jgi:hypothetical protein
MLARTIVAGDVSGTGGVNLEIQQAAHEGLELFDQCGIRVGNGLSELCENVVAFGGKSACIVRRDTI